MAESYLPGIPPIYKREVIYMFWSKDDIVEKLSKMPRTLEDISIEVFESVHPTSDFLYDASLSKGECADSTCVCRNLQTNASIEQANIEQVSIEKELTYPYMDASLSNEYVIHSTQYRFMLPYEIIGFDIKKEYRIFQPDELKTKFPIAYKQLMENESEFGNEKKKFNSADCYRLENESFLQYINTPKIIVTDHYNLQASYDPVGKHVFADGIGVVLGDPTLYHYVTAVLNSSISRAFPKIWEREHGYNRSRLCAKMLKRFPIVFPKAQIIENLVSTTSRYLIYLNRQKSEAMVYSILGYQSLIDFYKRILDLLILDTYMTNDLDPRLIEILAENITPLDEELEYSDDISLLIGLQAIKENILGFTDFRKCKFSNEFTNILATLKNNSVW